MFLLPRVFILCKGCHPYWKDIVEKSQFMHYDESQSKHFIFLLKILSKEKSKMIFSIRLLKVICDLVHEPVHSKKYFLKAIREKN